MVQFRVRSLLKQSSGWLLLWQSNIWARFSATIWVSSVDNRVRDDSFVLFPLIFWDYFHHWAHRSVFLLIINGFCVKGWKLYDSIWHFGETFPLIHNREGSVRLTVKAGTVSFVKYFIYDLSYMSTVPFLPWQSNLYTSSLGYLWANIPNPCTQDHCGPLFWIYMFSWVILGGFCEKQSSKIKTVEKNADILQIKIIKPPNPYTADGFNS